MSFSKKKIAIGIRRLHWTIHSKGYTKNLGIKVEYGTGESSWELRNRYLNTLLEKYKAELLELFDVNDFIEMAEKYGHEEGFMINDIMVIDNFTDLLALAKKQGI